MNVVELSTSYNYILKNCTCVYVAILGELESY